MSHIIRTRTKFPFKYYCFVQSVFERINTTTILKRPKCRKWRHFSHQPFFSGLLRKENRNLYQLFNSTVFFTSNAIKICYLYPKQPIYRTSMAKTVDLRVVIFDAERKSSLIILFRKRHIFHRNRNIYTIFISLDRGGCPHFPDTRESAVWWLGMKWAQIFKTSLSQK